jgi:hypothetical protein
VTDPRAQQRGEFERFERNGAGHEDLSGTDDCASNATFESRIRITNQQRGGSAVV